MSGLEAFILGIIQGLTEFLPVSSSGHLEIINVLFGNKSADNLTFTIVVHAGTVCSTMVILWPEISNLFINLFRLQWNNETKYVLKIFISMVPVGLIGAFFKDQVEALFGSNLYIVGGGLLLTACLLTFSYYARPRTKQEISFKNAFIIGIAQACAVIPGLSRSGATISTGLLLGNKKETVAQFSFLMVLVPILGETFLDILKGDFAGTATIPSFSLIVGFFTSFATGCIACKWMVNLVKKGKLIYFALYCVIVGLTVLIFS
ncbi:MAG: undecaprenyl-diphosphate phosphatase [Prevotellaceae bacterium]|jgi:undecaprenyl-diphosphatase|nr:undecaprenyl-diphosphate phosphatase [Prevotellaceae bacterium]